MKKRKFLIGLGAAVTGLSGLFGTSAFSTAEIERSVEINVSEDDHAFLGLDPIPNTGINGEYTERVVTRANGTIKFEIPGGGFGENSNAEGVGTDSRYEFDDLLRITNQGTQPTTVFSTYDGDALTDIGLLHDGKELRDTRPTLGVGNGIVVGLFIDTTGTPQRDDPYREQITIVGDATD